MISRYSGIATRRLSAVTRSMHPGDASKEMLLTPLSHFISQKDGNSDNMSYLEQFIRYLGYSGVVPCISYAPLECDDSYDGDVTIMTSSGKRTYNARQQWGFLLYTTGLAEGEEETSSYSIPAMTILQVVLDDQSINDYFHIWINF